MAAEYQETDWRVVDYATFCLDEKILDPTTGKPLFIRGPRPDRLAQGEYFVCLGAAQTFGRFCAQPFPTILEERLSMPVLNISHGGAGPAFFGAWSEHLLPYLHGARFVVVQVMSGRSASNSLFESDGVGHYRRKSDGAYLSCDEAFEELIRTVHRSQLEQLVEETRQSWCDSYAALLSAINVPKLLFWFATREPGYRQGWRNLAELYGGFPQLVNRHMVEALRAQCDFYAACTSTRGLPQILRDRFTGKKTTVADPWTTRPWTQNWYYPSPEMHIDAANALEPSCGEALGMNAAGVKRPHMNGNASLPPSALPR